MPNRGELPTPAMRAKAKAARAGTPFPYTETWMVIAFCAIGWLATFYLAVSSAGAGAAPGLMMQIPWG